MVRRHVGGAGSRSGSAALAAVAAVGAVLVGGGALGGCGADPPPADTVVSPTMSWTGERVAAGSFPTVPGYTWTPMPDEEWAQAWATLSSSFHGLLADGQARYAHDARNTSVGIVMVAWPAPGKGGPAVMKAALERQRQQAAERYGTAAVSEVAGHDVLEFTDSLRQPNWYWVSGDEVVMVTGRDFDQGEAFSALLAAATR